MVVAGDWVYLVGGFLQLGDPAIDRAPLRPDGTLGGPFVSALATPGLAHQPMVVVLGESIYLLGGQWPQVGYSNQVARTAIGDDGALSPVDGTPPALATARADAAALALGDFVYLIGGVTSDGDGGDRYLDTVAVVARR